MTIVSLTASPNVDDWLSIEEDGAVVVHTGKVEIGQRIGLALTRIVSEELDVDPARVQVLTADTDVAPDEGYTSGSNSVHHSGTALRLACATARRYLLAQAAHHLQATQESLRVEDGLVRVDGANQSVRYEDLMTDGRFDLAVDPAAPVKAPAAYRLVGVSNDSTPAALQPDTDGLLDGSVAFIQDFEMPDMLHARVVRPPHYHARLKTWTPPPTLRGGARVVRDGSFVAVAAEDEYDALMAARKLAGSLEWAAGPTLDTTDVFVALRSLERQSRPVVGGTPRDEPVPAPAPPPENAAVSLKACYERPYQMHGSIGPSAAAAIFSEGRLEVWSHSQGIFPLRGSLAEALSLAEDTITVYHLPGAGCYGHNGADDAALDAALIALRIPDRPVLLKWSREDEHAWEPYTSCMAVEMAASVDDDGRVLSWSHDSFSDTHMGRPRPGPGTGGARMLAAQHRDPPLTPNRARPSMANHAGLHRNADPIYHFDNTSVTKHLVADMPLRTSSMRTLGGFANVFAIESFMDELARTMELDPIAFRIKHLVDPRAIACLEKLGQQMASWPQVSAAGRGRGIGFARYKNQMAYAAVGIDLEVGDDAEVRLHKALIVADTGQVIDRDGAAAQLEGGMLQAASWCLYESVAFTPDGISSRDWDSYPILRFDNVPDVEVQLIPQQDLAPLGIGEASSGPTGAAIANAIYDACGLRLRRMPFTANAIRATALSDQKNP